MLVEKPQAYPTVRYGYTRAKRLPRGSVESLLAILSALEVCVPIACDLEPCSEEERLRFRARLTNMRLRLMAEAQRLHVAVIQQAVEDEQKQRTVSAA